LTATTKKGHQLFEEENVPPEKILATPMSLQLQQSRILDSAIHSV